MAKHDTNPNAVNIAEKIIDDDEFRYPGHKIETI
jgi:hypothetical protein